SGIGLFLGLTGCRVNASDALFLGMANAFIRKEQKEQFIEALQQISWRSDVASEAQNENRQHIESQLSILSEENAAFYPASQMVPYLPQIL
ncbi:enoyl-CoA hydratase/isomerase family protein, partial [Escherichia coli]|uniref:enoyl-CoA hydratase/isomerase family protein n=1 Tax=Escherichia coli TaxID=562 RepID=UPI001411C92C